jgi:4'-phosphopantetheinyl transferase
MLVLLLSNPLRFNNQKFLKLLSLPDQKKALDIHNRIVQAQFIGGRLLLKECLHRTNNDKLLNAKIVISKSGKPQLSHSKIKFNISHTDKLIACAIGSQDMGIDIEAINRRTILPKNTTLKQWV